MNKPSPRPQVIPRKDRPGAPWIFRYQLREIQADGTLRTIRKYKEIGPSEGRGAFTRRQAEAVRDELLGSMLRGDVTVTTMPAPVRVTPTERASAHGTVPFGELARLYRSGYLSRQNQVSEPTRQ